MKHKAKKYKNNQNVPLRRKIAILYTRSLIVLRVSIGIILFLLFFTDRLSAIRTLAYNNINHFVVDLGFTFEELLIEGQVNLTTAEINNLLNLKIGTAITSIDLKNLQTKIETNSWVEKAIVERKLPHRIKLVIKERVPIAIWQNNQEFFLIDKTGYLIAEYNGQKIKSFLHPLHVVGLDANIYANELLQEINKNETLSKKITSAVRYGQRRWNLNLFQGITVKMPESDFNKAYDYLTRLDVENKLFDQQYKTIDLRDPNKYYIEKIQD